MKRLGAFNVVFDEESNDGQPCLQCLSLKACETASKLPIAKGSKCENEK